MPARFPKTKTRSSESDLYQTPDPLFWFMNRRYRFDVDLAANGSNTKCQRWLGWHGHVAFLDALDVNRYWSAYGRTGWCNPPYSNIDPWLYWAKWEAEHTGFTTVFLIPSCNGEDRYGEQIFGVASEVIDIVGRVSFIRPGGKPANGNNRGSCYVVYRGFDLGQTRRVTVHRDDIFQAWRREQETMRAAA